MTCKNFNELRSRMTSSKCDSCQYGDIHLMFAPNSDAYRDPEVAYSDKDAKPGPCEYPRLCYGAPFHNE